MDKATIEIRRERIENHAAQILAGMHAACYDPMASTTYRLEDMARDALEQATILVDRIDRPAKHRAPKSLDRIVLQSGKVIPREKDGTKITAIRAIALELEDVVKARAAKAIKVAKKRATTRKKKSTKTRAGAATQRRRAIQAAETRHMTPSERDDILERAIKATE